MKWTSLLLVSATVSVVPGDALAVMPTGDSLATKSAHEILAQKPTNKTIASKATGVASGTKLSQASAELDTLEKRFFRHDFTNEPMDERLTRMEKFTFGETNKGTDQQRLARISSVLETHSADTPLSAIDTKPQKIAYAPPSQGYTQQMSDLDSSGDDSDDGSDYPHITYLEDEILGNHFSGSLQSRLSRLETKAFGSVSQNPDLSARTDALERYAEVKLHKKPFDQPVESPETARAPRYPSPGFGSWVRQGIPGGSMFNGMGGMGMGGSDDSDNDRAAAPARPSEDPAASLPTPPPEGARLLSRVAWCEMHLFNRTYPELHLLQRLHQLNAQLNPNDKEKDIELMDHVDKIVKEVVMRQHPPANPQVRS